jgi:hypothetical protein
MVSYFPKECFEADTDATPAKTLALTKDYGINPPALPPKGHLFRFLLPGTRPQSNNSLWVRKN